MPNILIVKCLKDDSDNEMADMANALETAKKKANHKVESVDFKDLLPMATKNYGSFPLKKFDEIYFTGHSRFFEAETNFHTRNWVVRKIEERTLGGYTPDELVPFIAFSIKNLAATSIVLFSCESALTVASYALDGGKNEEHSFTIDPIQEGRIKSWIRANLHNKVSLLQVMAMKVLDELRGQGHKQFRMSGMNGVGYIGKDGKILTFDQENLHKLNELKEARQQGKRMELERNFEEKCVHGKKSPHVLIYNLSST